MSGGESARVVGRYEVLEEIASGGMATVHLGRELGAAGRNRFVAVKRMHSQYARDADFRSMFLDEARLCASIRHENVGRTLDVVDADGELLLVLELIEGESLSRLAKQATARGDRIPIPITAAIVIQTLHGLHAAHEAVGESGEPLHMVHRDVSPHNVLCGSDGVVKVVDFGVAKARGRVQQTAQGQIKGKLAYMSPEQARGKEVDRRSDVFAAGIVLWELLAGQRLFEGENEAHVLTQLLTERPPLLGDRDPSLRPFEAVVDRALAVDPSARFASALEMALAMTEVMPPASRADLARWVNEAAGPALTRRRELIGKHLAIASRGDLDDTPRTELDEASTDGFGAKAPLPPLPTPPRAARPGELPMSALKTQKLDPADRPSLDLALPSYAASRRAAGATRLEAPSDRRPSDAPPAQSQVTSVALTTNDLPPPLPEARVRQLFMIGVVTATAVALSLGSVLVIASKRSPAKDPRAVASLGLARAAHVFAGPPPSRPAPVSTSAPTTPTDASTATPSAPSTAPPRPAPPAPRSAPSKPSTAKPSGGGAGGGATKTVSTPKKPR